MARFSFGKSRTVGSGIDFFRKVLNGQRAKRINNTWAAEGPLKKELDLWDASLKEKLSEKYPKDFTHQQLKYNGLLEGLACGHLRKQLIDDYCEGEEAKFNEMVGFLQGILEIVYKRAEETLKLETEQHQSPKTPSDRRSRVRKRRARRKKLRLNK